MKIFSWNFIRFALVAAAILSISAVFLITKPWNDDVEEYSASNYSDNVSIHSGRMAVYITPIGKAEERIIELEWIYPDRYKGKTNWIYPDPDGKITDDRGITDFILIQDKQYLKGVYKENINFYWPYMTARQLLYFLYDRGAQGLRDSLTDLKVLPDESIDDAECSHCRAIIDLDLMVEQAIEGFKSIPPNEISEEDLQKMIQDLEQLRTIKILVELWTDKNSGLFRQLKMDSLWFSPPMWGLEWDEASILVKYYDINENITIKPPLNIFGKLQGDWKQLPE